MSYPKKVNATFIVDNELQDERLYNALNSLGAIDITVFGNHEHLKDNTTFKKLLKAKKDAGLELDRFINKNRNA